MIGLFRYKSFLIGFTGIILLLISSIYIPFTGDGTHASILRKEDGTLLSAPYSPIDLPPFGSDRQGTSMFYKVIDGAKYTIFLMTVVSFFQVFLSVFLAGILILWGGYIKRAVYVILDSFNYMPTVILAIIFMMPMMLTNLDKVSLFIMTIQIVFIIVIMSPSLILLIAQEIELILTKPYVVISILMGAGRWHLWKVHVWPSLKAPMVILFFQQCVQTSMLFIYLGFFNVFLGGRVSTEGFESAETYKSIVNEWSSLIAIYHTELLTAPWIILAPTSMFAFTIFSLNLMKEGVVRYQK
ncbi:hypothetical protein ACH0BF_16790 [Pseudobacillus sp. 179-B 2D1 NHS]|uniref:hypothetical protein n=1 Tax=Pseudobacillus sp. 179-B 2D1 NHS TaxID=3374292 RepID=UPI003879F29B